MYRRSMSRTTWCSCSLWGVVRRVASRRSQDKTCIGQECWCAQVRRLWMLKTATCCTARQVSDKAILLQHWRYLKKLSRAAAAGTALLQSSQCCRRALVVSASGGVVLTVALSSLPRPCPVPPIVWSQPGAVSLAAVVAAAAGVWGAAAGQAAATAVGRLQGRPGPAHQTTNTVNTPLIGHESSHGDQPAYLKPAMYVDS